MTIFGPEFHVTVTIDYTGLQTQSLLKVLLRSRDFNH